MKYVVVSGGVVSGLGKGITSSSVGVLLRGCGLRVTSIKIDPYLNTDAGTMSPYEHGECYVLDDGGESDLDLGNYERFLGVTLTRDHNITTGKMFNHVFMKERRGDYLGKTVQIVPHVTDAIQAWIERIALVPVDGSDKVPDVCLIELGGTVGDIESMVYLEALRQLQHRVGKENFCLVHVSLVPTISGGLKTKPTQHGVKELRSAGLHADLVACRSTKPLEPAAAQKISEYAMVPPSSVISVYDVSNIYQVPLILLQQHAPQLILTKLNLVATVPLDLPEWRQMARVQDTAPKTITVAIVGKYTGLADSYLSITNALRHAATHSNLRLNIEWVDSQHIENTPSTQQPHQPQQQQPNVVKDEKRDVKADAAEGTLREVAWAKIRGADGVLVPGGFGDRGVLGMVAAVEWARVNKRPFLGICLGMQVMVIEWCRSQLGLADAHSTEFDKKSTAPVVIEMPEIDQVNLGGTMRLGSRRTNLKPNTLAAQLYFPTTPTATPTATATTNTAASGAASAAGAGAGAGVASGAGGVSDGKRGQFIMERHRHRFEVNPKYVGAIEKGGLAFSGVAERMHANDHSERMEIAELPRAAHPFFFGVQFHPEFLSRPLTPSPPFQGFVDACNKHQTLPKPTSP